MGDVVVAHYRIKREWQLIERYQLFAIAIEIVIVVVLLGRVVFVAHKHFFIVLLGPLSLMKSKKFAELLGDDFVYDSEQNDGYPILKWEKE